jgi:hypothetical protein
MLPKNHPSTQATRAWGLIGQPKLWWRENQVLCYVNSIFAVPPKILFLIVIRFSRLISQNAVSHFSSFFYVDETLTL